MFTPQEQKAHTTAGIEVLPALRKVLTVWAEGRTPPGETLRTVLGVLEREGIASPVAPFGSAYSNDREDAPINIKVFSDGTVITRTPEGWGKADSRPHGFHTGIHSGEHGTDGLATEQREGSSEGGAPPCDTLPSQEATARQGR